jgi:hypothetical protein
MADKLKNSAKKKTTSDLKKMAQDSMAWLKKKVSGVGSGSKQDKFGLGKLFFFYYDAKGKNTLPYYDRFPLVIPLEMYPDGFLGLNLHYLPLNYRMAFLDKLMDYADKGDAGEIMRIRISYDILSASKRFKEFKPCLKRYLTSQIQSKMFAVEPEEWQNAVYLPVQQFVGAPVSKVWQESIDKIEG